MKALAYERYRITKMQPNSTIEFTIYYQYCLKKWIQLTNEQKKYCEGGTIDAKKIFNVQKQSQILLIFCSGVKCKRLSRGSSFRKFPVDLTRKLKEILF